MARHLLARRARSSEEIAAATPKANAPVLEWVEAYGTFRAWIFAQAAEPGRNALAEEAMLEALREEPAKVRRIDGSVVHVHPKGLDSLMWFRQKDWLLEWLSPRVAALREALDRGEGSEAELPRPVSTLARCEEELAYQMSLLCAEATHEGPARGPWAQEEPEEVPEQWRDVNPHDMMSVHKGFVLVNSDRLQALNHIVQPQKSEGGSERMSWNVFLATMAQQLQMDPSVLASDRSLVSLLATVRLSRDTAQALER